MTVLRCRVCLCQVEPLNDQDLEEGYIHGSPIRMTEFIDTELGREVLEANIAVGDHWAGLGYSKHAYEECTNGNYFWDEPLLFEEHLYVATV